MEKTQIDAKLSATERLILQDLQKRESMTLKSSLDTELYSYRQYLRIIDKLIEKNVITGWIPVFHPFAGEYKKIVWFFLRTNPRDPQDLAYLQSLKGQLRSLDGIAGPYSLLALIQFSSDQEFNNSLESIDTKFSTPNPVYQNIRYQWLEIIAFYIYNGFPFSENSSLPEYDHALQQNLISLGLGKTRPPTLEELAEACNQSIATTQKQIKQLEKNRLILGYSIQINSLYQPPIKAIIQFHVLPKNYAQVLAILQEDPHVNLLCKIQKESFNLLAVVFCPTTQSLNSWLSSLYEEEGILDSLTTIVLKSEKTSATNESFPIL